MLSKLLKYDLRYVYKTLGIYYIATIASVICGILLLKIQNPPFIVGFLGMFFTNAGFGLSIGLIINAFARTWARFRQSLYGDESYLTHTLPISRLQLFASKFISAIIILLLSLLVVTIVMLLASDITIDFSAIIPGSSYTYLYCTFVLTLLLIMQLIFIIMCGFTGIVLGHRSNTHRALASALYGIISYVVVSLLLIGLFYLCGNFNPEIHTLFKYGYQPSASTLLNIAWICTAVYSTFIAIMFATNVIMLKRGVNVD